MALILLAGAGYAYYQQQEARFRLDDGIDLDDPALQSIEFLTTEVSNTILHSTLSTITFFEGASFEAVRPKLEARVNAIRAANPWLGGIVAQKRSDPHPRLFYGHSSVETPSSFQSFDLGDVPFTSRTAYHQYEDIIRDYRLKVPTLPEVMGSCRHPLWKVTLLPDAAEPDHKFALIVSMAHILGDAHTFYQLYHMLGDLQDDCHENVVEELNPQRIPEFQQEAQERLGGANEATFFQTANPALWERKTDKKGPQHRHKEHELLLFTIQPEWLARKREELLAQHKEEAAASKSSSSNPEEAEEALEMAASLSNEAIMVSWFFKTIVQPTIGLVAKSNLRNYCACLGELDAGNYLTPIPLVGPVDYETPLVVQQALGTGKRSGIILSPETAIPLDTASTSTNPPPPEGQALIAQQQQSYGSELPNRLLMAGPNAKFGLGVDWTRLLPRGELPLMGTTTHSDVAIQQGWHMPLHDALDLDCIPPRVSTIILFAAKNGTLGAMCLVSCQKEKKMSQRIIASGIIQETIAVV